MRLKTYEGHKGRTDSNQRTPMKQYQTRTGTSNIKLAAIAFLNHEPADPCTNEGKHSCGNKGMSGDLAGRDCRTAGSMNTFVAPDSQYNTLKRNRGKIKKYGQVLWLLNENVFDRKPLSSGWTSVWRQAQTSDQQKCLAAGSDTASF